MLPARVYKNLDSQTSSDDGEATFWKKETLYNEQFDAERSLLRAQKQGVELDTLSVLVAEYIQQGALDVKCGEKVT